MSVRKLRSFTDPKKVVKRRLQNPVSIRVTQTRVAYIPNQEDTHDC